MQHDRTDLKKNAFITLRDSGHTFDEIRRALNCSERTLYLWQNQIDDVDYQKEIEQETEEKEQGQQKEIEELKEHLDNLSRFYNNLWRQVHSKQDNVETEQERAYRSFFEVMMENSDKRQAILNQQLQKLNEYEVERELKQERLSKPDIYPDLHFNEHIEAMKRWNKELDIRNGRSSTGAIETEDPKRNKDEVVLETETIEGRRFERNIAERCFKRNVEKIVDEAFYRNPQNSQ